MSDEDTTKNPPAELEEGEGLGDEDGADFRALLKRSLGEPKEDDRSAEAPNLLPSVQKKLRERSRGKFYGDGWSTAQAKVSYALVAILMLVILAASYLALGPMGIK